MQILRPYSIAGRQHASSIFHQDKITNRFFQPSPAFQISGVVGRHMSLFPITELKSTATIPDLFVSFLAQKPVPNPNYAKVKGLLEASMRDIYGYRAGEYAKRVQADFSYFAALFAPTAAGPEYRTICDYFHWIFDFDDMFDDGHLSSDPQGARRELDGLLAVMTSDGNAVIPEHDKPKLVFQSIWNRIVEASQSQFNNL
ncbi:hypothetical protein EMCG_03136 [[Emmonsia] crescens]|uniref:Uncharacterized protein n=1 Tax=[Emmonsia] crescens TaxID=73230 RepID=A0A0G2HWM2_9EURO|nr:hypothetical protein EMCG_03136 [Emmonsia crescens UAMH 3008]